MAVRWRVTHALIQRFNVHKSMSDLRMLSSYCSLKVKYNEKKPFGLRMWTAQAGIVPTSRFE
jgi:hypothetical protein